MKHLDLFTGIGGFSLAAARCGIDTVAHAEIDKYASGCLERNFPDTPNLGDVADIDGKNYYGIDIITAGSPCQDFSVAGSRAGTAGARSGLISHTFRLVEETGTEWLVIENVPGLLSSNGGRDLGAVLGTLADLGMGFAWRVLDAQAFGVSQRRRRLFIVGHAGGSFAGPASVLSVGEGLPRDTPESQETRASNAGNALGSTRDAGIVGTLTASSLGGGGPEAKMAFAGHILPSGGGVRRLIPLECERLQGFPDGWTEGSSNLQRYRQLGNSVAVPVVEWLLDRIVKL